MVKINNKELKEVNGGTFFPNRYKKEQYHNAGIITQSNFITSDVFILRIDGHSEQVSMYEDRANEYVTYHLTHSEEQYIHFVQQRFPNFHRIYKGYEIV